MSFFRPHPSPASSTHQPRNKIRRRRRNSDSSTATTTTTATASADHVHQSFVVLLTGSTGNLGTYILDLLLAHPHVRKIICLNRSLEARDRQLAAHHARALTTDLDPARVFFLQADYSQSRLGLSIEIYDALLDAVDLIVHNAWLTDFESPLAAFKPCIDGVQNLIDFCVLAGRRRQQQRIQRPRTASTQRDRQQDQHQPTKLLFLSSLGPTTRTDPGSAANSQPSVPESECADWKLARTGYGQSKLISERVLTHSARKFQVPTAIVRLGQFAGPVTRGESGKWPEHDWLPSLIRSSFTLGALPETLGPLETLDWVPVDLGAQIVVELAMRFAAAEVTGAAEVTSAVEVTTRPATSGKATAAAASAKRGLPPCEARFWHVANPQTMEWTRLVWTIARYLPAGTRVLPFTAWVELLGQSAGEERASPAVARHWGFWEELREQAVRWPRLRAVRLETRETELVSPTLAGMRSVGADWMGLWMRQWRWNATIKETQWPLPA